MHEALLGAPKGLGTHAPRITTTFVATYGVQAVVYRSARDGNCIFWSLPSLFASLKFTMFGGKACMWVKKLCTTLPSVMGAFALGDDHFIPTAKQGHDQNDPGAESFVVVSTHLLLAPLCRWQGEGARNGGLKNAADKEAAHRFLCALLSPQRVWRVRLSLPSCGEEVEGRFAIESGSVRLRPDCPAHCSFFHLLSGGTDTGVPATETSIDFACALATGMPGVLAQIASELEWLLCHGYFLSGGTKWIVDTSQEHSKATKLMQYWYSGKAKFGDDTQYMSVSPDVGRIGRRSLFQAVIAGHDHVAMVAPPQDP